MKRYFIMAALTLFGTGLYAQNKKDRIQLVIKDAEHKINVLVDGKPFTDYFFPSDSILKKPVLFPILTSKGTTITRGYPFATRAGERVDHPHHVGMWLNYESVNGFDFWNNSTAIKDRSKYGTIKHTGIVQTNGGYGKATLKVTADWIDTDGKGKTLLKEKTTYVFHANGDQRIIDRITTLTALNEKVVFNDVKDGMFAIRVARELEHPSDKPDVFVDANGIQTKVDKLDNTGITGKYHTSENIDGEAAWSTRARWANLGGKIKNEDISICIIDHPKNVNYPTYWHARGYGLFAANPLGEKVFTNGKKELNYTLEPNQSVTFRYRTVITSGKTSDAQFNKLADEFAKSE
ncbi:Methane oxygenase PmoA [Pseudarcicella hirudinis]|uniref:Methane oxygenase PmoA n=1 Tax=Pseudarcicella hirudinis TaxID=1079859 RepID=A0A1I5MGD0_9BACT|nr:PmoA family protein [Pseudarcicella hirudinis]SFP08573.1 Methane oxygenase PmoA [Pseudarcicella hirudinis]